MAYARHQYAGNAAANITLAAGINASATSFTVSAAGNLPDGSVGPFVVTLNRGQSTEEKILCSTRSGTTCNVATSGRGYDSTTAASHNSGEAVEHTVSAVDLDEANYAVSQTVGKITAKGSLLAGTAANTLAERTVGADDTILMADAAQTTGLKWVASATPGSSAVGDTAAVGTADTFSRGDHVHGREAFAATPSTQAIGDAAAGGSATTVTRGDHKHAMPAFGGDGSAATLSRSDHTHTGLTPSYSAYTPTLTASTTNPTLGTGSAVAGRYTQAGKLVTGWAALTFGTSGANKGSGTYRVSLPVTAKANATFSIQVGTVRFFDASSGNFALGNCQIPFGSDVAYVEIYAEETGAPDLVTDIFPWSWANNDQIRVGFTYEAA